MAVLLPLAGGHLLAQTAAPPVQGPWLGTWMLNVEKSTYQTGQPPAGTVRTYVMTAAGPDSFDIVIDSRSPAGVQTMHMETRGARFDGKEYKEIGNPVADTNRFRIVNERSYEFVEAKNGVDVITITVEISADGRTRTSRQKGRGPDGQPTLNVAVWDRR
jgi:hypothetical protein